MQGFDPLPTSPSHSASGDLENKGATWEQQSLYGQTFVSQGIINQPPAKSWSSEKRWRYNIVYAAHIMLMLYFFLMPHDNGEIYINYFRKFEKQHMIKKVYSESRSKHPVKSSYSWQVQNWRSSSRNLLPPSCPRCLSLLRSVFKLLPTNLNK